MYRRSMRAGTYNALLYASASTKLFSNPNTAIQDEAGFDVLDEGGVPILDESLTTIGANGNGLAYCGPTGIGSNWYPSQVAISTSTAVSNPEAFLYIGPLVPVYALQNLLKTTQVTQIANSVNGSNDSIALLNITVPQGQALIVQWIGGDAGATAVMTVTGTQSATYFR